MLGVTLPIQGFLQSDQSQDGVILVLLIRYLGRMISLWVHQDFQRV